MKRICSAVFLCFCPIALAQDGLRSAQDMLLRLKNCQADIRIETFLDGKEYIVKGRYEEQVAGGQHSQFFRTQYRLEINFLMNSQPDAKSDPNRMTLVCHIDPIDREKSVIEKLTIIEGTTQYTSINIAKLEDRLRAVHQEAVFAQISEVRNLGGLAAMVRQLDRFYDFTTTAQEQLDTGKETVPVLKLTGTVKNVYYKDLLEHFGGLDKKKRPPADFPSDIEIWLGRHNDFPYRIRYQSAAKSLLLQETFSNVRINGETIPAAEFDLLKVSDSVFTHKDETEAFLKTLQF